MGALWVVNLLCWEGSHKGKLVSNESTTCVFFLFQKRQQLDTLDESKFEVSVENLLIDLCNSLLLEHLSNYEERKPLG